MKKFNFLTNKVRWLLVPLVLFTLGVGNAWGAMAEATIGTYASANSWTNGQYYSSMALNSDVTITANLSNGYYSSSSPGTWRFYQTNSGTLTVSTSSGTLNCMVVTYNVSNGGSLYDGSTAYASDVVIPLSGTSKTFTIGSTTGKTNGQVQIKHISVFYAPAGSSNVFRRISSVDDIKAGDDIVIVSQDETKALSTTQNTNNRGLASISVSEHSFTYSSTSNVQLLSVSINSGKYSFHDGVGYLKQPGNNNYLQRDATLGDNTKWTLDVSSYVFSINSVRNSSYYIAYNSGASIFATYTSTYEKPYIYKRAPSCTELGSINGSISWSNGTSATLTWNSMSNVDATTPYTVTYRTGSAAYGDTNVGSITTNGAGKKTCTITGLTAGTSYDFKIAVTAASNYCDKDSVMTSKAPLITASATLTGSDYAYGDGPGTEKSFTVSGVGLTGDITVTAPTNFEVSTTSGKLYSSSVVLSPSDGTLSSTAVYIRLAAGLSENDYSGNVTISGGGAANNTSVSIAGTVSAACHTPTISGQPAASASYNMNVTATALSVTAAKGDVSDPTLTYQWYSNTANSKTTPTPSPIDGATSSSYTPPTTASGTKYYFCEVSSGACSLTSNISAISVNTPTLSIGDDKTSIAFGDRAKDGSYDLTFTVSGSNLAKDAGISLALSGTNASLFSIDKTSISQTSTGAVSSTTVTVTYSPNVAGDHTATLTISSTGATNKVLSLSGSSKWVVTWKVNGSTSSTTYVANSSKPTPPDAPADNTLNNCANKFMGWSCKSWGSTPKTTGTGEYDDLFTSSDYSTKGPSITKDTVIYAVFAEGEDGTAQLTTAEITAAYCSGSGTCGSVTSYANGPYDISSNDGNWEGAVCAINNGNIGMRATDASQALGRPRLISPDYGGSVTKITISATNGSSSDDRYIYICSSATASPATENIGSGTATKKTTTDVVIEPSSAVSSFYIYVNDALTFTSIEVEYSSGENYVTQCAANQVRVTYDFNGGTGTACTEGVTTKSASYTVCSTEPEKNYYDFAGWSDGTNTYDAGDTYNLQATTEFTATWTPTVYTITYNLNGGTQQVTPAAPTSYTVESSDITLPTAPTKGHSRFDGWFDNSGLTGSAVTTIAAGSHGDTAFWAKWTARNEFKFYKDDELLATLYRASDENLEAAASGTLSGQGAKPSDPSAPSACSSKVFVGWTETWFNDETDTEPADLSDATGKKAAGKTYYAVWATRAGSPGSYTYSAYSTTCCGKSVEVDGGSPSNGTVTFDKSYAWTCKEDREIVMTITPAAGYQLHTFSVATGDGKVAAKSMSADVALDNNSSAAQVITLTFAKDADGDYDVTATFTEMTVTSWTWTYNSGDIPDPIDVYVGQKKQIDVVMSPSGVLSSHKNNNSYTHSVNATYIANPNRAGAYFTFEGKAATESTPITLTHNDDTSEPKTFALTFNVRVIALPTVTFIDQVHNKTDFTVGDDDLPASGILSAVVSGDKLTVTTTRPTPNHADVAEPGSGNACEKSHLHLVGWIDKDWADEHPNATHSEILGAGTGVYYAANTDIDLSAKNGKTFLAVWSKIE